MAFLTILSKILSAMNMLTEKKREKKNADSYWSTRLNDLIVTAGSDVRMM